MMVRWGTKEKSVPDKSMAESSQWCCWIADYVNLRFEKALYGNRLQVQGCKRSWSRGCWFEKCTKTLWGRFASSFAIPHIEKHPEKEEIKRYISKTSSLNLASGFFLLFWSLKVRIHVCSSPICVWRKYVILHYNSSVCFFLWSGLKNVKIKSQLEEQQMESSWISLNTVL